MKQDQDQIASGLRALARAQLPLSAPERVETALLAEFRRRRTAMLWRRGAAISSIAAALALAAPVLELRRAPSPPPRLAALIPAGSLDRTVVKPSPPPRRIRPARRSEAPPEEIASGFLPVLGAAPLEPFDRGRVVRVRVPRSAMGLFGLPINEDRFMQPVKA
ncbi:MAG: hypothetical protein ACRD96_27980, partial [Bryobacteraceae bacterium]